MWSVDTGSLKGKSMQLAASFADPHAPLATLTGGKGANLAKLTQAGLPVPDGFVVTAEAYSLFERAAAALLEPVDRFPFTDSAALELRCEQLVGQLVSLPVPAAVIAAIREKLPLLALDTPVSVRSSATTEDLGG